MNSAAGKRYTVKEVPWLRGSRRRTVERFRYFYQAQRLAQSLSAESRQVIIECGHRALETWLDGRRV
jgi:hypothetical protein